MSKLQRLGYHTLRVFGLLIGHPPGVSLRSTPGFMLPPATAGFWKGELALTCSEFPEVCRTLNMIAFFFIIGTHFFSWGSQPTPNQMQCGKCGTLGPFVRKQGMRFITLFFIIPVLPISGIKNLLQCPVCGTKFQTRS